MRRVRDILEYQYDLGDKLRGWKLLSAKAVSRDGSLVIGVGLNPKGNREAWIAQLGDNISIHTQTSQIVTP